VDGIQAYKGDAAPPSTSRPSITGALPAVNPAAVKSTSNYLTALKRRFWVVLAVAVPMAITTSILALKQPAVYMVRAEIEINPPDVDPWLSTLVATEGGGHREASSQSNYVATREVRLRKPELKERVISDPSIEPKVSQFADTAFELFKDLTVSRIKTSSSFIVSLEGTDPALTKDLLECLLKKFKEQTTDENVESLKATEGYAHDNLRSLVASVKDLDDRITTSLQNTRTLGPGGRSIPEEQYINLGMMMSQKQARMGEVHQQMMVAQLFPKFEAENGANSREGQLALLRQDQRMYEHRLVKMRHDIRNFNSDPAVIEASEALEATLDEIEKLSSSKPKAASSAAEMIVEQYGRELDADKENHEKLLAQMRESMPEVQQMSTLFRDREEKARQRSRMEERLGQFKTMRAAMLSGDCVRIPASLIEPTVPIKPNKPMLIVMGLFASIGLGIALVCLLEHIDHSVKVPEHVTHGLTLPLLGVVPRIRRTALTHRGGHLWTPGTPDSIEADAYRNVRASLLGVTDKRGPIVTLLVTSPKKGDGKSTTALNLAATCARAGERTLLLDVDLRRPSLADVFIEADPSADTHGLVDVLRGDMPWQRTVRHTEIPNLDFIPTGDTHDTPIEILGTLELRQLLVALEHHYDRVILDGPAVLGLADCRVLGRIVDASLLVVRSGAHHLMTLHRAKAMLEQSHVVIAGVVFNGMTEDMNNWSSYGYDPLPYSGGRSRTVTADTEPLALAASD
jgi:succinoglycan biosynthesis transport protein ExoP